MIILVPWQQGEGSALLWVVSVPRDPYTLLLSSAVLLVRDRLLCIRCTWRVCVKSVFVFVSMNVWSESGLFVGDERWLSLRGGSGPRGRRFQCCQRSPWRSSVVLTLRASLPSAVFGLLAAACLPPSPRSCPSLLTAWASTASLALMMEAACSHSEGVIPGRKTDEVLCFYKLNKHPLVGFVFSYS